MPADPEGSRRRTISARGAGLGSLRRLHGSGSPSASLHVEVSTWPGAGDETRRLGRATNAPTDCPGFRCRHSGRAASGGTLRCVGVMSGRRPPTRDCAWLVSNVKSAVNKTFKLGRTTRTCSLLPLPGWASPLQQNWVGKSGRTGFCNASSCWVDLGHPPCAPWKVSGVARGFGCHR